MLYQIGLRKTAFVLIDDEDFERIKPHKWLLFLNKYARTTDSNLLMHRLILDAPKGLTVDHINGNGLDNRKENLRICTQQENCFNSQARAGTSKYKGVSYSEKPRLRRHWVVQIEKDRKVKHLGCFDTEKEAAFCYNKYALELFGEFAKLNIL